MPTWEYWPDDWSWKTARSCAWFNHSHSRFKLKFKNNLRYVRSVEDLSSLRQTCCVNMRCWPQYVYKTLIVLWKYFASKFSLINNIIVDKAAWLVLESFTFLHYNLFHIVCTLINDNSISFSYQVFSSVGVDIMRNRDSKFLLLTLLIFDFFHYLLL